jgi:hypothetical protein
MKTNILLSSKKIETNKTETDNNILLTTIEKFADNIDVAKII